MSWEGELIIKEKQAASSRRATGGGMPNAACTDTASTERALPKSHHYT